MNTVLERVPAMQKKKINLEMETVFLKRGT